MILVASKKKKILSSKLSNKLWEKSLQYFGIKLWSEISLEIKCLSYLSFKKCIKTIYLTCMNYLMHDCL